MTVFNQWAHVTEKERKDQGHNVAAIDVGVAHDHDLVVPELFNIEYTGTIFFFDTDAKSRKHVLDFFIVVDTMLHRFFYVEDFSTQWKYRLEITITTLLGRTTGTISLHQVYLTLLRITRRAVRQFTRQSSSCQYVFTLYQFARLACSITCTCSDDYFFNDLLCIGWVLFEISSKRITYTLGHDTYYFRVTKFAFGLAFKLRLWHFNGDHGCQSFTVIFTGELHFSFGKQAAVVTIFFEDSGDRAFETCFVCTSVAGRDIIDK